MKLRNKLKISFFIMILLPVVLCAIVITGVLRLQADSLYKTYQIDNGNMLISFYSPMTLLGKLTDSVYEEMRLEAEENPSKFCDEEYLECQSEILHSKLSSLVVRKNGVITYSTSSLSNEQLEGFLPDYAGLEENVYDVGTYKGGEYQKLVKQLDFEDDDNNQYSVFIITSLKQVVPQMKTFIIEIMVAILLVLIITSLILTYWIYCSIVKPVNKLKLATDNIKNGNMDFEMPKVPNNEIGEVCRDFEEMRVILKQSSEDKIKSDQEEKELIRNISHDLKTPLTAIKGYVEGLLDGVADTPEKQQKYIRTIANKVNDMDKLIDELTIYSRLDTNRVPYTFSKIDVGEYFNDCCADLELELEALGIELEYRNHISAPSIIVADPEQLKRVVNNIISNSVKYMADGRKGRIQIDLFDEDDYAHVIFKDNGKGIASKDITRIFERFYRTDESRNSRQGGSGIGLAIVKKIVEDHKGKIWAESVEGEGTTMHLDLLKYKDNTFCIEDKKAQKENTKFMKRK